MSSTAFESVVRYHCEQSRSNTCLAACVAMVLTRRDGTRIEDILIRERDLCAELGTGRGGALIDLAAGTLDSRTIHADPDVPANLKRIQSDLSSGRWWIVAMMHPSALADHYASQRPPPLSRHGDLPMPPAPGHAIVLIAAASRTLVYLDPWFSAVHQPQQIDLSRFASAWTGRYIPALIDPA